MAPETTKVVPLTCHGHSRPITHISFSAVTEDDQFYLISGSKDNYPMLRDGVTGDWIGSFIGHKGAVWQTRLSSNARLAATASADFTAKIWDTTTGEAQHTLQHNHIVRAVAFPASPSPTLVATGGMEKKLRVWDLARCSTSAPATTDPSPNGTPTPPAAAAATTPPDGDASYEVAPGAHAGTIRSILWSPSDPNILITAADDAHIRWLDLRARAPIGSFATAAPPTSAELCATRASATDGTLAVAAGKHVYFWDAPTAPAATGFAPSTTHELPVDAACVAVSRATGRFVTGGGADTWVRVWSCDDARELEVGKGHHGPVWSVAFNPDEGVYGTGSEDGTIKLWKCKEGPYGLWR